MARIAQKMEKATLLSCLGPRSTQSSFLQIAGLTMCAFNVKRTIYVLKQETQHLAV